MYGILCGMLKTTLYLPEELKASLERLAVEEARSEAEIVREALQKAVDSRLSPRPRIPLVESGLGDPTVAERVDDLLSGFGQR